MRAAAGGRNERSPSIGGIGSLRGTAQCAERRLRHGRGAGARPRSGGDPGRAALVSRGSRTAWRRSAAAARSLRQRFQGHQCGFGGAGAGLLQRHFLDRRRQAEDRRHRVLARVLSAHPQGLSDRRSGGGIRRDARQRRAARDRRHARQGARRRRARCRSLAGREPVVLLSPACASFDQYRNFEVRGDAFRELVRALPGLKVNRHPEGGSRLRGRSLAPRDRPGKWFLIPFKPSRCHH